MTTLRVDVGVDVASVLAGVVTGSFATLTPTTDPSSPGGAS
jgi:hypothetical protein